MSDDYLLGDMITHALKMPTGFSGEFLLTGLRTCDGTFLPFQREEGTRTSFLLNIEALQPNTEYEAVYEGTCEYFCHMQTSEEIIWTF